MFKNVSMLLRAAYHIYKNDKKRRKEAEGRRREGGTVDRRGRNGC